jgi:hypothetical protein
LPVLASRLGGGDDGKRKVSMLAHNENLHSNEYVGKIKGADFLLIAVSRWAKRNSLSATSVPLW